MKSNVQYFPKLSSASLRQFETLSSQRYVVSICFAKTNRKNQWKYFYKIVIYFVNILKPNNTTCKNSNIIQLIFVQKFQLSQFKKLNMFSIKLIAKVLKLKFPIWIWDEQTAALEAIDSGFLLKELDDILILSVDFFTFQSTQIIP